MEEFREKIEIAGEKGEKKHTQEPHPLFLSGSLNEANEPADA